MLYPIFFSGLGGNPFETHWEHILSILSVKPTNVYWLSLQHWLSLQKKNNFFSSRHFSFLTTNNNFSTFWCWCFQPQFVSKKVENLRICGPVFELFWQKKSFFAKKWLLTMLKPFFMILISRQSLTNFLLFSKTKSRKKASKSSKTVFFKNHFFFQKNRKKVRESLSFRLFWKQIEARNISIKK